MTSTNTDKPFALYRDAPFTRSKGRVLLAEALTTYMALRFGIGPEQIADAHDRADDAGIRRQVELTARLIGESLQEGRFTTWARPLGGGDAVELKPDAWELDDFLHRFSTCSIDPRRPFDPTATPTHRIFIGEKDVAAIFEACCDDVPRRRQSGGSTVTEFGGQGAARRDTDPAPGRFLRLPEVEGLVGMKRSTIYDRIAAGRFPGPVKSGSRISVWREDEVRAWLAEPR